MLVVIDIDPEHWQGVTLRRLLEEANKDNRKDPIELGTERLAFHVTEIVGRIEDDMLPHLQAGDVIKRLL